MKKLLSSLALAFACAISINANPIAGVFAYWQEDNIFSIYGRPPAQGQIYFDGVPSGLEFTRDLSTTTEPSFSIGTHFITFQEWTPHTGELIGGLVSIGQYTIADWTAGPVHVKVPESSNAGMLLAFSFVALSGCRRLFGSRAH